MFKSTKFTNRKGFATVATLILLPLVLAIVAVASSAIFYVRTVEHGMHLCRGNLLAAQTDMLASFEVLVALNPEATSLRLALQQAEAQVQFAAANPLLLAAALARLHAVQEAQLILAAKQRSLIAEANLHSHSAGQKLWQSIQLLDHRIVQTLVATTVTPPFSPEEIKTPTLHVVARPRGSLTPDYFAAADFNQSQEFMFKWRVNTASLLPIWLTEWSGRPAEHIRFHCSSTSYLEGNRWTPGLKADKSLLSSYWQ